jgi:hypothetical protein
MGFMKSEENEKLMKILMIWVGEIIKRFQLFFDIYYNL